MPNEENGDSAAAVAPIANPAPDAAEPAGSPPPPPGPLPQPLIDEINELAAECKHRYKFNTKWDNLLNIGGLLLSVLIVAAGAYDHGKLSAILGGLVAAIVSAQKAYPFGQRLLFYRNLAGQAENLATDARTQQVGVREAVAALKTLRLDFAQQLPRGSSFKGGEGEK